MAEFWAEMARPDASYGDAIRNRAARTVHRNATGADDEAELLQMLGLVPAPVNDTINDMIRIKGWESYR